jgi:hypothetical protein
MPHAQGPAGGDADVRRGATHVQGDHVLEPGDLAGPDPSDQAGDRARHQQIHGPLRRRLDRCHPAGGLHQLHAVREALLPHRLVEPRHVARHLRADVGVQADGREALELPIEREHLVRDGQVRVRELLEHDLLDPPLVRRVQVRVEQADRDALDAGLAQLPYALAHLLLVEGRQHLAVRHGDALLHGQPVAALDERPRLPGQLLLEREVVRLLVAGDVEDVAHPLRRDQPDLGARVRERDVGGDRRAVQEVVDLAERDAGLGAQIADALDGAARRVVRRGRDLVDRDPARFLVDEDQVGKRPADVDAQAPHAGIAARAGMIVSPTRSSCSCLPFR